MTEANDPCVAVEPASLSCSVIQRVPFCRSVCHDEAVRDICFSPDGTRLASASEDRTVAVLRICGDVVDLEVQLKGHEDWVVAVAWHPAGNLLASASDDKKVIIWDVRDKDGLPGWRNRLLHTLQHADRVTRVEFSPDGSQLCVATDTNEAWLWDPQTGQRTFRLCGHVRSVLALAYSPDGTRLATGGADKTVLIWDPRHKARVWKAPVKSTSQWVRSLSFAPDSKSLVAGLDDAVTVRYDHASGHICEIYGGHSGAVWSLATVAADGVRSGLLATASTDATANIRDLQSGQLLQSLQGHQDAVYSVCFFPGKSTSCATCSRDGSVALWRLPTET